MTDEAPQPPPDDFPEPSLWQRREAWIALVALMAVVILCFSCWAAARKRDRSSTAMPVVAVATVEREDLHKEVTIPGEFRPYVEAELNAKVSGYLEKINVDFGDKVKQGQLLAVLEVPELKAELDSAMAAQRAD